MSARLGARDLLGVAASGVRTRRLRAALSALGIAIGIAAMVAVLGISSSSRADLLAQLDSLGTNLLRVTPGETFFGADAKLPQESRGMLRRIGPVQRVAATGNTDASVRRSDLIPEAETGGISVLAADPELLATVGGEPGTVYVRADPDQVEAVRSVLPATANPANPNEVRVSRPSDALAARAAANTAFTSLLLGLGAVALLVGGVGIANVMVISVLERRSEIGLRRALGATKGHVGLQFLAESLLLALAGGLTGVVLGAAVTTVYAAGRGWSVVVPATAMAGGILAALAIGAVAGLYPALRAARLAPTDALRTV
jgi:putative ABC transport system permease protein